MLYSDAHLHVNPIRGLGAGRIARKFKSTGGWFLSIISLPPHYYGFVEPSIESYRKVLDLLIREASRAKEQGVIVAVFMGFHPAEVDYYYKMGVKADRLSVIVDEVFKLIEDALRMGLIDGIGEVGRPHYGTSPERFVFSETIMVKAINLVRDYDVPIQLHTEQGGYATAYSVRQLVDLLKIPVSRIILHHASFETATWSDFFGLPFTAPIKQFDEKYASHKWSNCMVESDFLDDPNRPGVSAYPWEIPSTVRKLLESGVLSEEEVYRIMVDNIVRFFRVKPP